MIPWYTKDANQDLQPILYTEKILEPKIRANEQNTPFKLRHFLNQTKDYLDETWTPGIFPPSCPLPPLPTLLAHKCPFVPLELIPRIHSTIPGWKPKTAGISANLSELSYGRHLHFKETLAKVAKWPTAISHESNRARPAMTPFR